MQYLTVISVLSLVGTVAHAQPWQPTAAGARQRVQSVQERLAREDGSGGTEAALAMAAQKTAPGWNDKRSWTDGAGDQEVWFSVGKYRHEQPTLALTMAQNKALVELLQLGARRQNEQDGGATVVVTAMEALAKETHFVDWYAATDGTMYALAAHFPRAPRPGERPVRLGALAEKEAKDARNGAKKETNREAQREWGRQKHSYHSRDGDIELCATGEAPERAQADTNARAAVSRAIKSELKALLAGKRRQGSRVLRALNDDTLTLTGVNIVDHVEKPTGQAALACVSLTTLERSNVLFESLTAKQNKLLLRLLTKRARQSLQ